MSRSDTLEARASRVVAAAAAKGTKLATAESCTGGLIAATLTSIAGSSAVVDRGFVTYSNEAKAEMLGVDADLIARHGAVSEPVALAMAKGALARSHATIAVSVTGIAGPGGGTAAKPVGLVHLAAASRSAVIHREMDFGDIGRDAVRLGSVDVAFDLVEELLSKLDQAAVP